MSAFNAIGGAGVIRTVVDVFYRRVRDDSAVAQYFESVDPSQLAAHQRAFLTAALGGPDAYSGRDLAAAHAGLGIDDHAYDIVVEHLLASLRDLQVDSEVLHLLIDRLADLRPMVVHVA